MLSPFFGFCQTPVLGLGVGVAFALSWDNKNNKKNPQLYFLKGIVLGDKEQGVGIGDNGQGSRFKGQGSKDKG